MKNIIITTIIFLGLIALLLYYIFIEKKELKQDIYTKKEKIELLEKDLINEKDLTKKLKIDITNLELKIKKLEDFNESNIVNTDFNKNDISNLSENIILKFTEMNKGEWNLTNEKKEYIISLLKNEKESIYEIIPIIDEDTYKNDSQGLKQIGLSRTRAATAAGLIKSLNSKNKVFISTEIITSKNERGFIIKKINL
jgi:hypothetical protein